MTTVVAFAWALLLGCGAWMARPRRPRAFSAHLGAEPVVTCSRKRDARRRRLVRAAIGGGVVAPIALPLAPVVAGAVWGAPFLLARRAEARRREEVQRTLPEAVDLIHLAVGAGLTVPLALAAVTERADGPFVDELRRALEEVGLGRRLADALGDVAVRTGEATRPLIAALVESDRYGAPLAESLGRLAAEVRNDRRRRAEEAARKVPVKLLFPLVCCVLPAFGLLTMAPLLAGALGALRL